MKTTVSRPLLVAVLALLCLPFAQRTAHSQGVQSIFGDRELPGALLPEQWRRMEDLIRRPIPDISIFPTRPIKDLELLFQEKSPAFSLDFLEWKLEKLEVKLGSFGAVQVKFKGGEGRFTVGRNGLYGHVIVDGNFYAFAGLGGDKVVVEKVPFHVDATMDATEYGPAPPPETNPQCSADTTLSILVLISSSIAKDKSDMAEKIRLEMDGIDLALKNSGITRTVRPAETEIIDFVSTTSLHADVRTLSEMESVKELRRKTGADLVFLITDHVEGAAARQILAGRHGAFAVVSEENLNDPRFSFAHEFGHLLGAGHEAVQDGWHKDIPYATAFVPLKGAPNKWCDVMAVAERCQGRELVFSNPTTKWKSVTVGQDHDNVNNARAVDAMFAHAAKFNCVP
jgi:hypothetical protein